MVIRSIYDDWDEVMAAYPLTDGLKYSMALRYDHGFFIHTDEVKEKTLAEVVEIYEKLKSKDFKKPRGKTWQAIELVQLWEEATGKGFYSPGREQMYVDMFEGNRGRKGFPAFGSSL